MELNNYAYLRYIYQIIQKQRWWLALIVSMTIFWAFLYCYISYILKWIVDILEAGVEQGKVFEYLWLPCLVFVLSYLLLNVTSRIRMIASKVFYPKLQKQVTRKMHKVLQSQMLSHFQSQMTGGIVNRAVEFNRTLTAMMELSIVGLFIIAQLIIYFFFLMASSPWFSFVYVIWLAIFIPVTLRKSMQANHLARNYADSQTTMMGQMVDSINNIYFVKLFAQQHYESMRIEDVSQDTYGHAIDFKSYLIKLRWLMDGYILILMVVNIWLLMYLYSTGQVTAGDFVFVLTSVVEMTWFTSDFCGEKMPLLIEEYGKGFQAFHLFKACEMAQDEQGSKDIDVKKGAIDFENVVYGYDASNRLFNGFNLSIEPGEKVGLVGYSGSGKTTLLHLLLGFFHPDEGRITIDSQDIAEAKLDALRRYIAMIPQDTAMFHRSLRENIRYGNLEATDEMVVEAAKKAHAHEFISQLPEGYETMVGERGLKLSGGQRQRIAIARAFIKNAPIICLDEATSALDTVTEQAIYSSIQDLMKGRTVLVIAHRLSTIKSMDRIIVMEHGQIIEQGPHQALLDLGGHYAKMWASQDHKSGDVLDG